jgi:hypothetical protein
MWVLSGEGSAVGGVREGFWRVKRMEVCYATYACEVVKSAWWNPPHTVWERRKRASGNLVEEVNLFKVPCMCVWNFHNEIPLYY